MAAAPTASELKNLCKKHKPAIVYLMETRCREENVKKYARKLQFKNSFCVEPRDLSGSLCLLWNENINVSVYSWCQNYIIANIKSNNNPAWKCGFIYGNPVFKQRRKTWQALEESNDLEEEPSCLIGDFNDILCQEEKVGKHPKPLIQIEVFKNLVNKKNLMDLELKGNKFTWFSNPREGLVTRERLDRAMVNWKWRQAFSNASLTALPAITSDHCPLILNLKPNRNVPRQFKYEAYWDDKKECKEVVSKGWRTEDQEGGH
ncbi:uncharacterized protein [Arachis hypogaea]|uniref:uncharacterized protein n=1 Tax=Arachis hypogaea TaxID=3818 RepID=UPI003B21A411